MMHWNPDTGKLLAVFCVQKKDMTSKLTAIICNESLKDDFQHRGLGPYPANRLAATLKSIYSDKLNIPSFLSDYINNLYRMIQCS